MRFHIYDKNNYPNWSKQMLSVSIAVVTNENNTNTNEYNHEILCTRVS